MLFSLLSDSKKEKNILKTVAWWVAGSYIVGAIFFIISIVIVVVVIVTKATSWMPDWMKGVLGA